MADVIKIAQEVVDAFNANDWERSEAPLKEDTLYNEVGTERKLRGPGEIIPALKAWHTHRSSPVTRWRYSSLREAASHPLSLGVRFRRRQDPGKPQLL